MLSKGNTASNSQEFIQEKSFPLNNEKKKEKKKGKQKLHGEKIQENSCPNYIRKTP